MKTTYPIENYTPAHVQAVAGIPPELIRNWRTRGYLDGIGFSDGKDWFYSRRDLVALLFLNYARGMPDGWGMSVIKASEFASALRKLLDDHWDMVDARHLMLFGKIGDKYVILPYDDLDGYLRKQDSLFDIRVMNLGYVLTALDARLVIEGLAK